MRIASRVAGSSSAARILLKSSRHDIPASTRIRVRALETTMLLPFDPLASTVIRIILSRYARSMWKTCT